MASTSVQHLDEADLAAHALEERRRQAHVVVGVAVQPPHEGHDVDHHAARAQHAVALGEDLVRIGDVLEHRVDPTRSSGPRAEGQRGGVGHDVDRVRGVDVEADELGQAVGVGELARALVAERGPRTELEVDRTARSGRRVGVGARRVPRRAGAGQQRVDAVEQVRRATRPGARAAWPRARRPARAPRPGGLSTRPKSRSTRPGSARRATESTLGLPLTRGIMPARPPGARRQRAAKR